MFLRAKVDSKTRQIVFIDNKDAVAGILGDYNVDGVIFMLPENEDYFEFLNTSVIRVIFFTPDGASHNQVLTSRDEVYGMPKWTFDNNILSLDHTAYIKFFIVLTKTNLSGQILKSWSSLPNNLMLIKNRDYDNQEEQAAMDTEIDRLAGLVTELTSKAASIGDVERLLETITGSSPKPAATTSDLATADPTKLYLVAADGRIYYYLNDQWNPGPVYGSYSLDSTLTQSGQAADAKATGDRIGAVEEDLEDVKEDLSAVSGLSEDVKQALLDCFNHVAWTNEYGQDYYDALEEALYPPAVLTGITAVYTQSGTVYDTDSLDSLKSDLVVTARYSDGTYRGVTTYTLSGALTVGTSTITVAYSGKTTTFTVTVTQARVPEGFREVEWIGSGAGNLGMYISSGTFKLPSAFTAEAKTQLTGWNANATYGNVIAVFQHNASTYGYELAYKKDDSTIVSFLGAQSVVTPSDINAEIVIGTVCNGTTEQAYMVVNGERVYGTSVSVTRNYTSEKVGVFAGGNSVLNQFVGKLFYLNIYDSTNVLISELIPCYRVSDGVIGLYDAVADEFLTNTNDTYTKGADV